MSPDPPPPTFCHPLLSDFSQFVPAGLPQPTAQHLFLTAVALVVTLCAQQIKYSVIVAIAALVNGHHHQCLIAVSSLYWF
jgi:hypothetical protein